MKLALKAGLCQKTAQGQCLVPLIFVIPRDISVGWQFHRANVVQLCLCPKHV